MKDQAHLFSHARNRVITMSRKEQRQAARQRDRILRQVAKRRRGQGGDLSALLRQRRKAQTHVLSQHLGDYADWLQRQEGLSPVQVDRLLRHLRAALRAALPSDTYCATCKAISRVLRARRPSVGVPITAIGVNGQPIPPRGQARWYPTHAWLDEDLRP